MLRSHRAEGVFSCPCTRRRGTVARAALIPQDCWEFIMHREEVVVSPPVCPELIAIHQNQLQKHS